MTVLDFKQVLIRIVQSTEIKCIGSSNLDSSTCFIGQSQPAGITTPAHRLRTSITLFHIIDSRLVSTKIRRILTVTIIFYRTATIPFQLLQRRIKESLQRQTGKIKVIIRCKRSIHIYFTITIQTVNQCIRHFHISDGFLQLNRYNCRLIIS